jgi:site-specific recombinase XerD
VKGRPKTLGAEFIDDLLEVTGGGKARDFEAARDHAMIRILRSEGIRRSELLGMVMHTLPADVTKNPLVRLVPLKAARAAGEGRLIALAPASARALAVYLRARRHHALADSEWVWLGTRNRGRLQETGLRMMLVRRAEQAPGVTVYTAGNTKPPASPLVHQVGGHLPRSNKGTSADKPGKAAASQVPVPGRRPGSILQQSRISFS